MKSAITIFSLLINSIFCFSQSISGTIKDMNNQPGSYVEIVVKEKNGAIKKGTISDEKGVYTIELLKNGTYLLTVYRFNEKIFEQELIIDGDIINDISFDKTVKLEEVTVVSKKKLIENKVDRLVFNVENSISSSGMDLTEVLSLTPMVMVDDFGISIVGKSGVSIMVNSKMLNISENELINYLRSLRSDDVAKVEVITAPPAKYDAEGNSGIINIVLKKNQKLGWSGNLSVSYFQTTFPGFSTNATLNYRSDKINTSLRIRQYDRKLGSTEDINVVGVNSILSSDKRNDMFNGVGANLSLDYKVSTNSNIGFIYDITKRNNDMDIDNTTDYRTKSAIDSILTTISKHRNPTLVHTLNAYYDIKLDNKGESLSFVANYFENLPNTIVDFKTISNIKPLDNKIVRNKSEIDYTIWSVQTDLNYPVKWIKMETGAKYTRFHNESDVKYLNFTAEDYVIDPLKSNVFDYEEQNIAGYISVTKELEKRWSAKAGLRYEYSLVEGFSPTTNKKNSDKYASWFPTIYLSYQPDNKNFFSINYSKRINRPPFRTLNPFRWYSNPYMYYTGNPILQPSFSHNIELSYGYKNIFSVRLYNQKLVNGYGRIVKLINGVERVVNYANYLAQRNRGITTSLFLSLFKCWDNYISVNASYSTSDSSIPQVLPQQGYSFYYSSNNTVVLSKAKKIRFLVNFWNSLLSKGGNVKSMGLSSLSVGLKFPLVRGKFQVDLMANDLFKGTVSKGEIYFSDFIQFYNNYYDTRRFTFSLTYSFGNRNVRENNKKIKFDEKYRGN